MFLYNYISLSVKRIPLRWSISCWRIQALNPEYFCFFHLPFLSWNFTTIRWCLLTFPCSPGTERQASSEICISCELSTMLGFMRSVSQRKSFSACFPLGIFFHCVVAIIAIFLPICGAASQTPSYARMSSIRISAKSLISSLILEMVFHQALKMLFSFQVSRG